MNHGPDPTIDPPKRHCCIDAIVKAWKRQPLGRLRLPFYPEGWDSLNFFTTCSKWAGSAIFLVFLAYGFVAMAGYGTIQDGSQVTHQINYQTLSQMA